MQTPVELLRHWLDRQIAPDHKAWIELQDAKVDAANSDQALYLAVSLAPRVLGKDDLALTQDDLARAEAARAGWNPRDWSIDQAGRLYFLLAHGGTGEIFAKRLHQLMASADVAEEITFLRGLPLYPDQADHEATARKGCRTNMRPVFEAIAHNNPFPREQFDENAWNHLVLKALFVDSTLHPFQGFEERMNPELARILRDYAHERWAASRHVTPELWRGVGRFADGDALIDLKRVVQSSDPSERLAGALALRDNPKPEAAEILIAANVRVPDGLSWTNLLTQGGSALS